MSADDRADMIAGLRELAAWLEAHPDVPVDRWHKMDVFVRNADRGYLSEIDAIAELRRVGAALGAELVQNGPHVEVRGPRFRGSVRYEAVVCNVNLDAHPLDGGPHACAICGRLHEAHDGANDITRGGGKVAGSDEGTGPATDTATGWTAPTDNGGPLPHLVGLEPTADAALSDSDTETVWVATRRKGIEYHLPVHGEHTSCGRSTAAGVHVGRGEAKDFLAVQCPRCYPGGAA